MAVARISRRTCAQTQQAVDLVSRSLLGPRREPVTDRLPCVHVSLRSVTTCSVDQSDRSCTSRRHLHPAVDLAAACASGGGSEAGRDGGGDSVNGNFSEFFSANSGVRSFSNRFQRHWGETRCLRTSQFSDARPCIRESFTFSRNSSSPFAGKISLLHSSQGFAVTSRNLVTSRSSSSSPKANSSPEGKSQKEREGRRKEEEKEEREEREGREGREEFESADEENLGWRSHWGFKLLVAATIAGVAINAFPLMGDTLIRHSIALLRAKDPFLRRSGAYRLAFIASNDETRRKIVAAGALPHLLLLLDVPTEHSPTGSNALTPSERRTLKEALNCLSLLAESDAAALAMVEAGAMSRLQQAAAWVSQHQGEGNGDGDGLDELIGPIDALIARLLPPAVDTSS